MGQIKPFTSGPANAIEKLNELIKIVNSLQSITGDGFIKVSRTVGGVTIALNMPRVIDNIPKLGGGNQIRRAYCKTDASTGTTLTCYLDEDEDGEEITVNFLISNGGTDLEDCTPVLKDGDPIPVFQKDGEWFCNDIFSPSCVSEATCA